jgi:hypothetical protein
VIRTINLFTKAVLDTPSSWLDKFSSVWRERRRQRRVIRGHKRAHDLPEDGKIGQQRWLAINTPKFPKVVFYRGPDEEKSIHQSFFQRLGNKSGTPWVVLNECNSP